jgi:hypothetical protein
MRLVFVVTLALVLLVALPASAGVWLAKTPGGVAAYVSSGHGLAVFRNRGAFRGSVKAGRIWATNAVTVTGWDSRVRLGPNLVRYSGHPADQQDLMRISVDHDVFWRIKMRGTGIYGGGPMIRGCLTLDGVDRGKTGTWRIVAKSGKWPRTRTSFRLGPGTC